MGNRLLQFVFVVVALVASVSLLEAALPRYLPFDWANAHDYDALTDWRSAKLFVDGRNPFTPEGRAAIGIGLNGHPPSTLFWFIPLAGFSKALTAEIVGVSVWFALVVHVHLCARAVRFPSPVALTLFVVSFLLTTGTILSHFQAVQLSEHIALCYAVAWWHLRRGEDGRAGIALGIAATLKLFPGLMLLLLLVGRRFRGFAAGSLTFLSIALVLMPTVGLSSWFSFLGQQGPIATTWIGHVRNASLQGIVLRLYHPICTGQAVPNKTTTLTATLAALVFVGVAVLAVRRRMRDARSGDPTAVDVPFSLFALLSVFLNPWAWEHYNVFLIQPLFVIGAAAWGQWAEGFVLWRTDRASHGELARRSVLLAAGVSIIVATAFMLTLGISAKENLLGLWQATKNPWYHRYLHLYEVANWLPWVLGIASSYAILFASLVATPAPARAFAFRVADRDERGDL